MSEVVDVRKIVSEARLEARAMSNSRIEAEHMLLALARHPELPAGRLLVERGLDYETIRHALDLEFERSLSAVGISLAGFSVPKAAAMTNDPRYLGHSAKLALQRALQARSGRGRGRRLGSLHVLLGILSAQGGTVVRALAAIDVDHNDVANSVRAAFRQAA